MRKLKITEHISLDGVIQVSGEDADFPYGDWTAPDRPPAGREAIIAAHGGSLMKMGDFPEAREEIQRAIAMTQNLREQNC
jgi:hypothetical protein